MSQIPLPSVDTVAPPGGLTASQAAEALGIPTETLRYYDRAGLLREPTPRNAGGQRRFRQSDLEWIAAIIMLRETGMSISRIRDVAELSRTAGTEPERLEVFLTHREHVLELRERTRRHLDAIEHKIAAYRDAITEKDDE